MSRQALSNVEIESHVQALNKNQEFRVIETVEKTVETSLDMLKHPSFKVLRLSQQVKTSFFKCRDRESNRDLNKNLEFRVIETVETTVKTSLNMLKCHLQSVETFSTCEDKLFQMLRSRVTFKLSTKIKSLG
jgi:hypothetical protein